MKLLQAPPDTYLGRANKGAHAPLKSASRGTALVSGRSRTNRAPTTRRACSSVAAHPSTLHVCIMARPFPQRVGSSLNRLHGRKYTLRCDNFGMIRFVGTCIEFPPDTPTPQSDAEQEKDGSEAHAFRREVNARAGRAH